VDECRTIAGYSECHERMRDADYFSRSLFGLTSQIEPCMMQQGKLRPLHTEHVLTGYDLSLATREIPSSAKIVGISSVFIATGIPISVGADSN